MKDDLLSSSPNCSNTFVVRRFSCQNKIMIPKEQAAQLIVDSIALMVIKVAEITETETKYKKQELLEAVIKRLNEIV